jgi:exosome complex RNA-binding protein Csl4
MDSHIKGPVTGQHNAAVVSQRGFKVTTTKTKLCTVEASVAEPVIIEFSGQGGGNNVSSDHGGGDVVRAAAWSAPIELTARTDVYGVIAASTGRLYLRATGVGNGVPI